MSRTQYLTNSRTTHCNTHCYRYTTQQADPLNLFNVYISTSKSLQHVTNSTCHELNMSRTQNSLCYTLLSVYDIIKQTLQITPLQYLNMSRTQYDMNSKLSVYTSLSVYDIIKQTLRMAPLQYVNMSRTHDSLYYTSVSV